MSFKTSSIEADRRGGVRLSTPSSYLWRYTRLINSILHTNGSLLSTFFRVVNCDLCPLLTR